MKKIAKSLVATVLGWQVRRLRKKHQFKVVCVAGSIGKTSTKLAVANVLSNYYKVRYQKGNYNDIVSVPLIFFGTELLSLLNPIAWIKVFVQNEKKIKKSYPFDYVVVEVGTDAPGQLEAFGDYLDCDLGVLTSISPEHMENFDTLNDVAKEELQIANYCDKLLVNSDLVDDKYLHKVPIEVISLGEKSKDFQLQNAKFNNGFVDFKIAGEMFHMQAVGMGEVYSASLAVAVANIFGHEIQDLVDDLAKLEPASGRMRRFEGVNGSTILDETYNASPTAVMAALDGLYQIDAPQKIAILGNMNEMGKHSKKLHEQVGAYCDPEQLDLVVTLGVDANDHLAKAAGDRGCKVKIANHPLEAAELVKKELKRGAVILAKGSQNGVFAEEAVKALLKNKSDEKYLVRQSDQWMKDKRKSLGHV